MRLRLEPLPTLAAVLAFSLFVGLGQWQQGRAHDKQALAERSARLELSPPVVLGSAPVDPAALERRRVVAEGTWVAERAVLLDNRVRRGTPGYEVLMPIRIRGSSMHALVNRGWIAAGRTRDQLPVVATPEGHVRIEGIGRLAAPRSLELGRPSYEGRVWQNLDIERYAAWSGLAVQPLLVLQTSPAEDGLAREWPRPDFGIDKHLGYAFQWNALAALTAALFLYFSWGRRDAQ